MSIAEASPGESEKKPRIGLSTILYGLGISSAQVMHGSSDTLAAKILEDEGLAQFSITRAALGLGAFALCATYYKKHYMNKPQHHEAAAELTPEDTATVIELPAREQPIDMSNLIPEIPGNDKMTA